MGNNKKIFKMSLEILLTISLFVGGLTILSVLVGPDFEFFETLQFYVSTVLMLYIIAMTIFLSIVFAFKFGKTRAGKEAGKIDFETEKSYYRDILERYSILELAYLNSMSTLKEKDLAAGLLGLELKKVIKFQDNKITSIDRSVSLVTNETHLLKNIVHGKLKVDKINYLTETVEKDAIIEG